MSDRLTLRLFSRAVDVFREVDPDAPMGLLSVFMMVATEPGLNGRDLQRKTGLPQSSISRHTLSLGEYSYKKGLPGLHLIERQDDPTDLRLKRFFLTAAGQTLAVKLVKTLDPTGDDPDPRSFPTYEQWLKDGAR